MTEIVVNQTVVEIIQRPAIASVVNPVTTVAQVTTAGPQGPQGPPGTAGAGFNFTQPTPSTTWTINHNLGFNPSVELFSVGGMEIDGDVQHTSLNQTVVTFLIPVAGSARLG